MATCMPLPEAYAAPNNPTHIKRYHVFSSVNTLGSLSKYLDPTCQSILNTSKPSKTLKVSSKILSILFLSSIDRFVLSCFLNFSYQFKQIWTRLILRKECLYFLMKRGFFWIKNDHTRFLHRYLPYLLLVFNRLISCFLQPDLFLCCKVIP